MQRKNRAEKKDIKMEGHVIIIFDMQGNEFPVRITNYLCLQKK